MNPVNSLPSTSLRYIIKQGDILQSQAATYKFRGQEGLQEASSMPRNTVLGRTVNLTITHCYLLSVRQMIHILCVNNKTEVIMLKIPGATVQNVIARGLLHSRFNISPTIYSSKVWRSLSFRLFYKNPVCISFLALPCHMTKKRYVKKDRTKLMFVS